MPPINKYKWTYQFIFDFGNEGTKNWSYTTDLGFKEADEQAFNTAMWDGTRKYLYAGKYKANAE